MKVKKVEETLMGPKHKATERCGIFNPVIEELTSLDDIVFSLKILVLGPISVSSTFLTFIANAFSAFIPSSK